MYNFAVQRFGGKCIPCVQTFITRNPVSEFIHVSVADPAWCFITTNFKNFVKFAQWIRRAELISPDIAYNFQFLGPHTYTPATMMG